MSNYNKATNFAVKDTLTSGDPDKVVSGAEIDNEFNSIASAVTSKADKVAAATSNNFAGLNANGNLIDSGKSAFDFVENNEIIDFITEDDVDTKFSITGSAPVYACRAWVNFDGTGTVSIRDSGNVSSVVTSGTGDFTVFFETAMPDANYSFVGTQNGSTQNMNPSIISLTASSARFYTSGGSGNGAGVEFFRVDPPFVCISIFR